MASDGKNLVGVDIGTSSIKVCEISEDRKGNRALVRFGYHPLPPQTIVDGHIMNAGADRRRARSALPQGQAPRRGAARQRAQRDHQEDHHAA